MDFVDFLNCGEAHMNTPEGMVALQQVRKCINWCIGWHYQSVPECVK